MENLFFPYVERCLLMVYSIIFDFIELSFFELCVVLALACFIRENVYIAHLSSSVFALRIDDFALLLINIHIHISMDLEYLLVVSASANRSDVCIAYADG